MMENEIIGTKVLEMSSTYSYIDLLRYGNE
jgi:hypothetical protein